MLSQNYILAERYRIVKAVGSGSQGIVYEAVDERLGRVVALKETVANEERLREVLASEARLLASLGKHPSLPTVFDYFSLGGSQFIAMEYVAGHDLAQLLKERGEPFPIAQVLLWAEDLLSALALMHSHVPPVIHRDIKPRNLKLNDHDRIVLLDFGLAKDQRAGSLIAGFTPLYAPPEQMQEIATDARSDLYSLAATLYHLSTNAVPKDAMARLAALASGHSDPLLPAREVNPSIPASVSAALERSMSLDRELRPTSASVMLEELRLTSHAPYKQDETETTLLKGRASADRRGVGGHIKYGILGRGEAHILSVAFSPDGKSVVAGSWDRTIRQWDATTGEMRVVGRCDSPVSSIAFSPDGKFLASASSDVRLWNVKTGEVVKSWNQFSFCVTFSPDGRKLAWGSKSPGGDEGAVCVWEVGEALPMVLGLSKRWIRTLDFSPDSGSIVSGSWNGLDSVCLWDVAGRSLRSLGCCQDGADCVTFSHSGQYVACAGRKITLVDLIAGDARAIGSPDEALSCVAFSPDDKYIVSGGRGICLWDIGTGSEYKIGTYSGHVNAVAYSPNGMSIVAGGNDKTVQIWPASCGEPNR